MHTKSVIRFAPSTTGYAHPGTLLSALLCWLDARKNNSSFVIRLENLDPDRCKPHFEKSMLDDLAWFGLDWDTVINQKSNTLNHEAALDHLASLGLLYPCTCSRSRLRSIGRVAPDGGYAYDNLCRAKILSEGGWRNCRDSIRVKLPDDSISFRDEGGLEIVQHPLSEMGDPIVRRRDGSIAYHLACVVDDHDLGISRIIRGRDLVSSAPTQILLQKLLGYSQPIYRHHFLLLENADAKLAKFHGAVGVPELRKHYSPEQLCGMIALWCGLQESADACRPAEMVSAFSWSSIRTSDLAVTWNDHRLMIDTNQHP